MQAAKHVEELEHEKSQELAAWEQSRSALVLETSGLQASNAALKERVAALEAVVNTCKSEFALVMSATQELEALVTAIDQKNRSIQKRTYELEVVLVDAGRICGEAAAEFAGHIVHVEGLEKSVSLRHYMIHCSLQRLTLECSFVNCTNCSLS